MIPRRGPLRPVGVLVACLLLTATGPVACKRKPPATDAAALRSGTSDVENLPPPDVGAAVRPRPKEAQRAPERRSQDPPIYPASALDDEVHCTAKILYHIETDGSANLVRLEWDPAPPAAHLFAFETAIREAMATWEYTPAERIRWDLEEDGSIFTEPQKIPKAANAVIRFRVVEGQPIVD